MTTPKKTAPKKIVKDKKPTPQKIIERQAILKEQIEANAKRRC